MKKQYIAPLTEVVKINVEQLICNSPALTGTYSGGTVLSKENEEFDEDLW